MDIGLINIAVEHFGKENQISKAIEEMAELTCELARYQNNKGMNINIIEEIADVCIMVEQLKQIFGNDLVDCHIKMKLKRLKSRIESPE